MKEILLEHFGFQSPIVKKLNGYINANYLVENDSLKYIFKTYEYDKEQLAIAEAESEALIHLQEPATSGYPKPIAFKDGQFVKAITLNGQPTICRMLSFLAGDFMGDVPATEELAQSLGIFLARLDLKLQNFDSYVFRARQWEWDIQFLYFNKKYLNDIPNAHNRNIVNHFMLQFEEHVVPKSLELRKQIIHNDPNEWNILVNEGQVNGIIDFGDLAHTYLINELAVAIVYLCYDKTDPLPWATTMLKAYHSVLPLKENEVEVLYYLIAARLCISVCNSAHARKIDPDNNYATVSEDAAWAMLHKWLKTSPLGAEMTFKEALGMSLRPISTTEDQLARRYQSLSPILSTSYKRPISMTHAAFQYMYDNEGHAILDAYNNIPHVGHSHPKVVAAGQRQMALLNTNTRYLYDLLPAYAERLLSKFPASLSKVFFVNSGSAATDLAMRLVYAHTGHKNIMVMEHGYHGNTQIGIDVSDYKFNNPKGQGQKSYILKAPIPDTYRGKFTNNDGSAGRSYAQEAIEIMERADQPIAAFITEPIVGCGGQVPLASGYLKEIYPAIRKQGGVCISDEVQTGFGRMGDHFWGYEAQEVVPDIVILGKPMANGHPMGAVVCTDEIAESFGKGVEFFSSFGGNPVSCAIGLSVLDVIEEEQLQQNAKDVGDYYKSLLKGLQKNYPCIGDVRGSGLFLGVEMVEAGTLNPDTALAHLIKNELRNNNILISTDGPYDSVLKTKPPLCFTRENAELVVESIEKVLKSRC
jgi:ethanolamine-phosphate phospho-lyase